MVRATVDDLCTSVDLLNHSEEVSRILNEASSEAAGWLEAIAKVFRADDGVVLLAAVGGGLTVLQNFEQDLLDTPVRVQPMLVGGSAALTTKVQNDMTTDEFADRIFVRAGIVAVLATTCSGRTKLVDSILRRAKEDCIPAFIVHGETPKYVEETSLMLATRRSDVFEDCLSQIMHVLVSRLQREYRAEISA